MAVRPAHTGVVLEALLAAVWSAERRAGKALRVVDAVGALVAVVAGARVYFSPNGGGTWKLLLDKGFPLDVLSVHWNANSGILYVGTGGQGVFRLPLKHIIAEKFGR